MTKVTHKDGLDPISSFVLFSGIDCAQSCQSKTFDTLFVDNSVPDGNSIVVRYVFEVVVLRRDTAIGLWRWPSMCPHALPPNREAILECHHRTKSTHRTLSLLFNSWQPYTVQFCSAARFSQDNRPVWSDSLCAANCCVSVESTFLVYYLLCDLFKCRVSAQVINPFNQFNIYTTWSFLCPSSPFLVPSVIHKSIVFSNCVLNVFSAHLWLCIKQQS